VKLKTVLLLIYLIPISAIGQQTVEQCVQERLKTADPTVTVGELRSDCEVNLENSPKPEARALQRLEMGKRTEWNPFVLTAHKQNYILPFTYMAHPNQAPYEGLGAGLPENSEVKMQISFKVPLTEHDLLVPGDSLYFGFTLQAYWQLYNRDISSPFRETDYEPEVFYTLPLFIHERKEGAALRFGLDHQSNGGGVAVSRSWNRIYAQWFYARDNYLISVRPWYRIPEAQKSSPDQASGDDNPDIEYYMGYFDLQGVWDFNHYEASVLIRNNLRSDNKGAVELGLSFPLWGRLRGYAQYFNGYGESLIDYNYRMERIGLGVLLTDML
jgi:phospholipase A1/A2